MDEYMPRLLIPLIAAFLYGSGCNEPDRIYDFKGRVVSVDDSGKSVTIDHEDIPGLMRAMKMPFTVDDPELIKDLIPGMSVEGKMKIASGKYYLLELKKRVAPIGPEREIQDAFSKLVPSDRKRVEMQGLCPISGEALGTKGLPVKLMIQDEPVFLCCKECVEKANANPDDTLKKVANLRKR